MIGCVSSTYRTICKSISKNPWSLPLQLDEIKPAFHPFGLSFKDLVPKIRQVLAENSIAQNQNWADTYTV